MPEQCNVSRRSRRGWGGQSATELALIAPVIVIMLLGIVDIAGAYGTRMTLQSAAAQAARIGAIEGNAGNTPTSCPFGPSSDAVDANIVNTLLKTQGLDRASVQKIEIYKSDLNGGTTGTLVDSYVGPFTPTAPYTATPYNWPSCHRNAAEPSDSLGVRVTYTYHPITPLFGRLILTINDNVVQRINPGKGVSPCPIPDPPNDVVAHWDTAQPEPTASDIITWTAVPGASSYKVFADVNGAGLGATPVYTVTSPPSSGPVVATYMGNLTFAPAAYAVRGSNFCGDGDISNEAINYQPALPISPTIITATASAQPAQDTLTWTAVPAARAYTITQTSSTSSLSITVAAPTTSAVITDTQYPLTVTYRVAATSLSNVLGPPSAAVVVTPTAPAPPLPTTSGLVGWWRFDEGTGITTTDSSPPGGHTGTLFHGATWTPGPPTIVPTAPFSNAVAFSSTLSAYVTATVSSSGTNLPAAGITQSVSWWMKPTISPPLTQTVIFLADPSNTSGLKLGFRGNLLGAWDYNNNALVTTTIPATTTASWHHYAFTFDPIGTPKARLYIDGAQVAAASPSPAWSGKVPTRLEFGRSSVALNTGSEYFAGSLDDVRIYTQALSVADVQNLRVQP